MARPKKQVKLKEPIKIRLKSLADGNKSIYLDIYYKGVRKYEYLLFSAMGHPFQQLAEMILRSSVTSGSSLV